MIDRILRISYNEYMIVYTHRKPVVLTSSGNCLELLKFLLEEAYVSPFDHSNDEAA